MSNQNTPFPFAEAVLNHAPVGVVVVDSKNRIALINEVMRQTLDLGSKNVLGAPVSVLGGAFQKIIAQQETVVDLPATGDKPIRTLKCWTTSTTAGGTKLQAFFTLDVTELHHIYVERDRLAEELARLTTRDPQTGLPNKQALLQSLDPLVSRSRRYNNPLSVIRLKLGTPAELDAAHGPGAGERTMVAVTQLLRDQMRWADLVGRYAEDEFLLILPETPGDNAQTLVDKLVGKISQLTIKNNKNQTFSIKPHFGVASWKKGDDIALLLSAAEDKITQQAVGA